MKGPLLDFQKTVHKNKMKISDSVETSYCLLCGQASLDCNRWLEGLSLAVVSELKLRGNFRQIFYLQISTGSRARRRKLHDTNHFSNWCFGLQSVTGDTGSPKGGVNWHWLATCWLPWDSGFLIRNLIRWGEDGNRLGREVRGAVGCG